MLVPFGGAEHHWAAVELGAWLARAEGLPLRLAGPEAVPEQGRRDASRLLSHGSLAVQRVLGIETESLLVAAGAEGLLDASRDAGLLIVGCRRAGTARDSAGTTPTGEGRRAADPARPSRRASR